MSQAVHTATHEPNYPMAFIVELWVVLERDVLFEQAWRQTCLYVLKFKSQPLYGVFTEMEHSVMISI